ncbi:MAG: hypothetical protein JWM78_2051 [Verrucomicrobiaceae bacterium]|nr:hypothetical protein [Verrucomicrobiaceae bacterium]
MRLRPVNALPQQPLAKGKHSFATDLRLKAGAALPFHVLAADATDNGAAGATGASGVIGKVGGSGQAAQAGLASSDFTNTVSTSGGKGGNGGASFPLLPGGNGGKGGAAAATLNTAGHVFPTDASVQVIDSVTARGGAGGNGGAGLIAGKGGAGGTATANGANAGAASGETAVDFASQINAIGGNGGAGITGGAGGNGNAVGSQIPGSTTASSTTTAQAQGGDGGAAVLSAGNGGDARAAVTLGVTGNPSYSTITATATGGSGGASQTGLHGNGGTASAVVSSELSSGNIGTSLSATAIGGASGSNSSASLLLRGNGGDATATSISGNGNPAATFADSHAAAQGGAGAVRGGNAVSTASNRAFLSSEASAQASAGAGKLAGAAVATAQAISLGEGGIATASANSAGTFVRQVTASGRSYDRGSSTPIGTYAQASVGNSDALLASVAPPSADATLTVHAAAPTAAQTAAALQGNSHIAGQFAGGSVWGLGSVDAGNPTGQEESQYTFNDASISYTLDVATIANPQHLWLGLFDSNLADDSIGNFHFSIAGEGAALFEHDFSGSDFLTYFDDRIFDLGSWANLVSSDGLFNLDVSFSGYVPRLEFAVGEITSLSPSVPEPSALALILAGLLSLAMSQTKRAVSRKGLPQRRRMREKSHVVAIEQNGLKPF